MGEGWPKYLFKDEEGSQFQSLCPIGAHTEEPCRNLKSRKYSEPSPFRKSPTELPKIEAHGKSDLKGAEPSAAFSPEESFPPYSVNSLFSTKECSGLGRLTGKGLALVAVQRCIKGVVLFPKSLWKYSKEKPSTPHPPFSPKSGLTIAIGYCESEASDC